ncbi:MAG: hypothetical protein AAF563_02495 [Pseudomonadota bacterium]
METIIFSIFGYLLIGIPVAVMFNRIGKTWAWSLLVLIPYIGLPIAAVILAVSDWEPRGRRA